MYLVRILPRHYRSLMQSGEDMWDRVNKGPGDPDEADDYDDEDDWDETDDDDMDDDKTQYIDWDKKADIKAQLKVQVILTLAKHKYPPATRDEVFKAIFEQAEYFKKNKSITDVGTEPAVQKKVSRQESPPGSDDSQGFDAGGR